MTDLSTRICDLPDVLGTLEITRSGEIIGKCYLTESTQFLLENLRTLLLPLVQHCESRDQNLEYLHLRFHKLTVFVKIYPRGYIITLCNSDVIVYLLDGAIASILAETE